MSTPSSYDTKIYYNTFDGVTTHTSYDPNGVENSDLGNSQLAWIQIIPEMKDQITTIKEDKNNMTVIIDKNDLCVKELSVRKMKRYKVYVWILTFLAYTSYHLSRKPISVVKGVLHPSCNESTTVNCTAWKPFGGDNGDALLGTLDSCFLFAYAVGMFISGHIAERVNLRYFLSAGMVGVGIFTCLFGMAQYWHIHNMGYFVVVQIAGGLFQSTGWPSVVACVANWFGKGRRGIVMGIWNAHTSVGNILGGIIPGVFADYEHWGLAFIVPGIIIGSLGILMFFILIPYPEEVGLESPNNPKSQIMNVNGEDTPEASRALLEDTDDTEDAQTTTTSEIQDSTQAISLWRALMIPGVIEFSMCLFFAKLVSYTFLFWLPLYIKNTSSYTNTQSADLATIYDVGGIVGAIMAGGMADVTRRPGVVCMVMLALAAPGMYLYNQFGTYNFAVNIELLLLMGLLCNGPYALITTAVSADLGTHKCLQGNAKALATVTAIIDGTGSIGAAIGPLLTGLISEHHGWQSVFYMLIFADLLAMVFLTRIVFNELRSLCHPPPQNVDGDVL